MLPDEIFGKFSKYIRSYKDCWLWEGPIVRGFPRIHTQNVTLRAQAYACRQVGEPLNQQEFLMVCENEMCVHPDHVATLHSDVGRMFYIRDHSEQDGDCQIWTGSTDRGNPRMPHVILREDGTRKQKLVSVRAFVWRVEHLPPDVDAPKHKNYRLSCGREDCVSPKHVEMVNEVDVTYEFV